MKREIIAWIRNWATDDFAAGMELYVQATGQQPGTNILESEANRRVLAIRLGNVLKRANNLSSTNNLAPEPASSGKSVILSLSKEGPDSVDLPLQSKIALDIDSLIKLRRAGHNALHDMTTDADRRHKLEELEQIQERIIYCRQIMRSLQAGQAVKYDAYIPASEEDDFQVPDNPLALQKKYQLMLQKRSKRKARLANLTEDNKDYHEVLHDWKHLENVVAHLKAKLDEYKKPSA